jgi:hypothetical protein
VYLVSSPFRFSTTDEFQTLRSLIDLQRSHHLFSPNPLVTAYPRFPGSQIAFVTMKQLTGLSFSASVSLIVGPEHLCLGIALFALVEQFSGSSLAGYAGVLVYATNESYLYFDAQAFYESFALPLAIFALFLVALAARSTSRRERRVLLSLASVIGIVVCVSHHMTSYWLGAVLAAWCALAVVRRRTGSPRHVRRRFPVESALVPWAPAATISICAGLWYAFVARAQVGNELGPTLEASVKAVKSIVFGSGFPKVPFSTPSAVPAVNDPLALQAIGYLSVLLALVILGGGLWQLRHRQMRGVGVLLLSLVALLLPIGLALRLTQASTETSSRSSEFAFVGLAGLAGLCVSAWYRGTGADHVGRTRRVSKHQGVVAGVLVVVAVLLAIGGVVVGQAPYDRVPGTYLVGDALRSIEPLGLETAEWADDHWAPGAKFAADFTNTGLIASGADFSPEDGVIEGYPVDHLFLSRSVDAEDMTIIQGDKIKYVVVDQRLTEFLSATGPVFGGSEPGVKVEASEPVPSRDFAKFASSSQFSRVYDDGTIRIYMTNVPTLKTG